MASFEMTFNCPAYIDHHFRPDEFTVEAVDIKEAEDKALALIAEKKGLPKLRFKELHSEEVETLSGEFIGWIEFW